MARPRRASWTGVETVRDVALLCLVGEGLGAKEGIRRQGLSASSPATASTSALISAGRIDRGPHLHVKRKDLEKTTKTIHHEFFGGDMAKVAFQGVQGAFSEDASAAFFPGVGNNALPRTSRASSGRWRGAIAEYGIVPVENSLEGTVAAVNDLLLENRPG
jgi:hypothetical protein